MKRTYLLFALLIALAAFALLGAAQAEGGACGDGLTWSLSGTTLTISGTGPMADYTADGTSGQSPFPRGKIYSVSIGNGVTRVGNYAFDGCNVSSVSFGSGVKTIGNYAFRGAPLYTVTVPGNVTSIYPGVFSGCTSLNTLTLPANLSIIPGQLCSGCTSLRTINWPTSCTGIGASAFAGCTRLTSLQLPSGVRSVYANAFQNCSSLRLISVPESIVTMTASAFSGCAEDLGLMGAPGGAVQSWCAANSFTFVPNGGACGSALTWTLSTTGILTISGTGEMDNYTLSSPSPFPKNYVTQVIVRPGVTAIGERAFLSFSQLKSVTLADTVTHIYYAAFSHCGAMTHANIGGVRHISGYAFERCTALTNINPSSAEWVNAYAFYLCTSLTSIELPATCATVGNSAFEVCAKLAQVRILSLNPSLGTNVFNGCAADLTVYGAADSQTQTAAEAVNARFVACTGRCGATGSDVVWAFNDATGTLSITGTGEMAYANAASDWPWHARRDEILHGCVGEGVTRLGAYTFTQTPNMSDVELSSTLTYISSYCFADSGLEWIELPDGLTDIGYSIFNNCDNLTDITLPAGVTHIPMFTLANCDSLTQVQCLGEVEAFGDNAFSGSPNLTTITGAEHIREIYNDVFEDCTALQRLYIPEDAVVRTNAFEGCTALTVCGITGSQAETAANACAVAFRSYGSPCGGGTYWRLNPENGYMTVSGSGAMQDYANIYNQPWNGVRSEIKEVSISGGVTHVSDFAFMLCSKLTDVTINEGVTSIGQGAFSLNSMLKTSVYLPASLSSLGNTAFAYSAISGVYIEDGHLTAIPKNCFSSCGSLTWAELGDSVTTLGESCFADCADELFLYAYNVSVVAGNAFSGTNSVIFSAPWGCPAQRTAEQLGLGYRLNLYNMIWSGQFNDHYDMTLIEEEAFANTPMKTITMPYTRDLRIGSRAFADSDDLELVFFPCDPTYLADDAFAGCPNVHLSGWSEEVEHYALSHGIPWVEAEQGL